MYDLCMIYLYHTSRADQKPPLPSFPPSPTSTPTPPCPRSEEWNNTMTTRAKCERFGGRRSSSSSSPSSAEPTQKTSRKFISKTNRHHRQRFQEHPTASMRTTGTFREFSGIFSKRSGGNVLRTFRWDFSRNVPVGIFSERSGGNVLGTFR